MCIWDNENRCCMNTKRNGDAQRVSNLYGFQRFTTAVMCVKREAKTTKTKQKKNVSVDNCNYLPQMQILK